MEKGSPRKRKSIKRILITGPESTGKSDLSEYLARHFSGSFIPEYAREYIEKLQRPYRYEDVVTIAEKQLSEYMEIVEQVKSKKIKGKSDGNGDENREGKGDENREGRGDENREGKDDERNVRNMWVFFDTWLIVSKVWMDVVFEKSPDWIDEALKKASFDLVLVCAPDIPWEPDTQRENGGEERNKLYQRYISELDQLGWEYRIVRGSGEERRRNAVDHIEER